MAGVAKVKGLLIEIYIPPLQEMNDLHHLCDFSQACLHGSISGQRNVSLNLTGSS
jgi:hypothetical protein